MSKKIIVGAAAMVIGLAATPAMAETSTFSVHAVSVDAFGRVSVGGSDLAQFIPDGMSEEQLLAANNCACTNPGCTQPN